MSLNKELKGFQRSKTCFLYSPGATWTLLSILISGYTDIRHSKLYSLPVCSLAGTKCTLLATDVWVCFSRGADGSFSSTWVKQPCDLPSQPPSRLPAALCNVICLLMGSSLISFRVGIAKTCAQSPWVLDSASWVDFVSLLRARG